MMLKFVLSILLLELISSVSFAQVQIVSHRGVHQALKSGQDIKWDTCTASLIENTGHGFIENTKSSTRSAFGYGADIVEIDFRVTSDGHAIVFHDFGLDCRTDAIEKGCQKQSYGGKQWCLVWQHSLSFIKTLNIGHWYTHDGGKTFPLRDQRNESVSTLATFLSSFEGKELLLNFKKDDVDSIGPAISAVKSLPPLARRKIWWYGMNPAEQGRVLSKVPESRVFFKSKPELKKCLGWLASNKGMNEAPRFCKNTQLGIPFRQFKALGQKAKFLISKAHAVGSKFVVADVENVSDAKYVLSFPIDYIWTNHIEIVGPAVRK